MIWVKTKRVIHSGFVSFWRNGFVSLSSILVMFITLSVIGGILFTSAILTSYLQQIKNRVDINVYFVTTAVESDVLTIKKSLEALPEVAKVEYASREQELENFKKKHEGDQLTLQALEELKDNPLGAVLNVRAKETSQYESIALFLGGKDVLSKDGTSIIYKINYFQNKTAIDTLTRFIDAGRKVGFVMTIVLAIVSVLITFNTIRLVIYISREEISVMKLVGASNRYIRGPFVVSGVIYGIVAAIITLVLFFPLTYWLGPITESFYTGINLFSFYLTNFAQFLLILTGSGMAIGAISSYMAVKKYLRF